MRGAADRRRPAARVGRRVAGQPTWLRSSGDAVRRVRQLLCAAHAESTRAGRSSRLSFMVCRVDVRRLYPCRWWCWCGRRGDRARSHPPSRGDDRQMDARGHRHQRRKPSRFGRDSPGRRADGRADAGHAAGWSRRATARQRIPGAAVGRAGLAAGGDGVGIAVETVKGLRRQCSPVEELAGAVGVGARSTPQPAAR